MHDHFTPLTLYALACFACCCSLLASRRGLIRVIFLLDCAIFFSSVVVAFYKYRKFKCGTQQDKKEHNNEKLEFLFIFL